jgi:hypothetical protein
MRPGTRSSTRRGTATDAAHGVWCLRPTSQHVRLHGRTASSIQFLKQPHASQLVNLGIDDFAIALPLFARDAARRVWTPARGHKQHLVTSGIVSPINEGGREQGAQRRVHETYLAGAFGSLLTLLYFCPRGLLGGATAIKRFLRFARFRRSMIESANRFFQERTLSATMSKKTHAH